MDVVLGAMLIRLLAVLSGALVLGSFPASAHQGTSSSAGATPPSNASSTNVPVNHQDGTGAISGVVFDGATKRPIGGALVYLGIQGYGPVGHMSREVTDVRGRFVFPDLPPSDLFFLNVTKAGYNDGNYGDSAPTTSGVGGGVVRLAAGQWFPTANIPLWRPGAIGGTVTDEFGQPVVGAHVRVLARIFIAGLPHLAGGSGTTTDDRGQYRIAGLPPGTYLVTVPSVQSTVPSTASALDIEGLTPDTATRARDDHPRNNGAVALDESHLLIIGNFVTPPLSDGRPQAYPQAFYPAATSPTEATPIVLESGTSRDDVDLALRPVPTVRVSGHVDGPPEAVRGLVLRLVAADLDDVAQGSEAATSLVAADGSFAFLNVPPGGYTLEASRSRLAFSYGPSRVVASDAIPSTPGLGPSPGGLTSGLYSGPPNALVTGTRVSGDLGAWARLPVTVGGSDLTDLTVPLRRAVSIRGRVAFDGAGPPPGPTLIVAEPADGRASLGMPQSTTRAALNDQPGDEEFQIDGLLPGDYVIRVVGLGPRQAVKSIVIGGVDYTTRTIDASTGQDLTNAVITFTDQIATITGSVAADPGGPALMSVIVFPAARDQWTRYGLTPSRFKAVPVANGGAFKIDNVPAGTYQLVAVEASQARRWQDPAFLEAASRVGATVTVGWGQTASQDLHVSVIK